MIKKISACSIIIFSLVAPLQGMYLMPPYENMLRPEMVDEYSWQCSSYLEHGFASQAFDEEGNHVSVGRLWNADQNALKMLEGFDPLSAIGQRRIQIAANDDGVRGHFTVDADLDYRLGAGFSARLGLPHNLCAGVHMPFYSVRLRNVRWQEQTKNITADDARVKQYLTNDFFNNVAQLGGLNLQPWSRSGVGDLTIMAEWVRDFEQKKDFLHNVRLQARTAVIVPTGKKADEDLLFARAFASDGAFGLVLGGGLTLTLACYLRFGVDVELTHLFSAIRERRIKTHKDQTDLLLLQKVDALKDYGLTQRFNLFLEAHRFVSGVSCKVGYQFLRHNDDTLTLCDNRFSSTIANTAKSLQEWTQHNLFFVLSYDGDHDACSYIHPYISTYVKVPFNGQFSYGAKTVGCMLSVDF